MLSVDRQITQDIALYSPEEFYQLIVYVYHTVNKRMGHATLNFINTDLCFIDCFII